MKNLISHRAQSFDALWGEKQKTHLKGSLQYKYFPAKNRISLEELKTIGVVLGIRSGRVRFNLIGAEGQKFTVFTLRKDDPAQWLAMIGQYPAEYYVEVFFCDDTELCLISSSDFKQFIANDREFREQYYRSCAEAMINALTVIGNLSFCSLEDRLEKRLMEECAENGTDTVLITHEELAEELGTSREVVSRLLSRMVKQSRIRVRRKMITVLPLQKKLPKDVNEVRKNGADPDE